MFVLKIILVIFFLLMCIISFGGTFEGADGQKKTIKELSAIFGSLAILAAVVVK